MLRRPILSDSAPNARKNGAPNVSATINASFPQSGPSGASADAMNATAVMPLATTNDAGRGNRMAPSASA